MNACVRCSLRLATIHICMVLTACASPPPPPSWLDFTGSTAPPIVLRMAEGSPRNEALPSPIGQFAGYAGSGVLGALMLALPTFGVSLILVPLGLVEGAKEAGRAGECAAQWEATVRDVPKWLEATFGEVSALTIVEEEVRRLLVKPPPVVEVAQPGPAHEAPTVELERISQRLSSPTLLVGDLWVALEQSERSSCDPKISGYAHFRLHGIDRPTNAVPDYLLSVTHEAPEAGIEGWAADPELAREQLRQVLRELAARIVSAYPWR